MQMIRGYHRPSELEEAISLLARDDIARAVVAGGTAITAADLPEATEVVDIQDVVGSTVTRHGDRAVFEAMARLQDIVDGDATPPLISALARREGPNTLRNASTIGGTVAEAHGESELVAGLLVHEGIVTLASSAGETEVALADLLANRGLLKGAIITAVSAVIGGETASARTGRTPADTSIVAAVGRIVPDGLRVALTGVAATPILIDQDDLSNLEPPGDFRGTAAYRKELAAVLTKRVVTQLGGAA